MKRAAESAGETPPAKKVYHILPVDMGEVNSEDDLNCKTLKVQNKQLSIRLQQLRAEQKELNSRITDLEKRRVTEDSALCTINRFWNQLDDDLQSLMTRCDPSDHIEEEPRDATRSFLQALEYDENSSSLERDLEKRCAFSKVLMSKLLIKMDKLTQKQTILRKLANEMYGSDDSSNRNKEIDITLRSEVGDLASRNENLENLITSLQEKQHINKLQLSQLTDKAKLLESELSEALTELEDYRYNLNKEKRKTEKLNKHLMLIDQSGNVGPSAASSVVAEPTTQGNNAEASGVGDSGEVESTQVVPINQHEEVVAELNEYRDISNNRLNELEKMQRELESAKREVETLSYERSIVAEDVILKSGHYLNVQSRLSIAESEALQLRSQNEDLRRLINQCRSQHESCLEQLESDQINLYNEAKAEVTRLQSILQKLTQEYDDIETKYQQYTPAHSQEIFLYFKASRLAELEYFMKTTKDRNKQLTEEIARLKQKLVDSDSYREKKKQARKLDNSKTNSGNAESTNDHTMKDLRNQLKKAQESQREMKILLDVYKSNVKDKRDKIEILASERRSKEEVEYLKVKLNQKDTEIANAEKLALEKVKPHILESEESVKILQKKLASTKQEQETLLAEMEMTGQAFEDMQEQNARLLEQIKEKDDMNFKLMTESIKANQTKKVYTKEKTFLEEKLSLLHDEVENQKILCKKFEENEKLLQSTITVKDQELQLRIQSSEACERTLNELRQTVIGNKMELDNFRSLYQKIQSSLDSKVSDFEKDSFKLRRVQEERNSLKRKLDRLKKVDSMTSADEVLSEEVKMYKAKLTCPCCNVKKKDTVLTKCFHVFCSDCIKTRYETRQRKCPKCNAAFGANDYHRLYI
ncbi:E3 ubiquitin-protein ligase BRE1B [Trichoplax sp. H2]|nr:E3 ubiquitin-protein ligase BRE1B [Trichoplax sp. H2]|eukprot:RDD38109.1 E3 ubiquitin-protein ligase BRE1B [Trichoplax sp. H2]